MDDGQDSERMELNSLESEEEKEDPDLSFKEENSEKKALLDQDRLPEQDGTPTATEDTVVQMPGFNTMESSLPVPEREYDDRPMMKIDMLCRSPMYEDRVYPIRDPARSLKPQYMASACRPPMYPDTDQIDSGNGDTIIPCVVPDTNMRPKIPGGDNGPFTGKRVSDAAERGDKSQLNGLLDYLKEKKQKLSSREFRDEGKTALINAMLQLKDKNEAIEELLVIAEETEDLEAFINTPHNDPEYEGHTALHIAIERRSMYYVKLLVQKGADVQAKATGKFFRPNERNGFYFGELPLSLAACTIQPDIVSFLIENDTKRANLTDQDSSGNTVLHALVAVADNETEYSVNKDTFSSMYDKILLEKTMNLNWEANGIYEERTPPLRKLRAVPGKTELLELLEKENTNVYAKMYDKILTEYNKPEKNTENPLEAIENKEKLTPLKLAAKLGKIGLFKHMLHREFEDENMKNLNRKKKGWHYGLVQSSLHDMTSIDTNEPNSVLKILVYGSDIPNRAEMLQIEPLSSILEDKWDRFAQKLFWVNFLVYLVYLIIFTTAAFYRKDGQPPFPLEDPLDYLRTVGEIISVLGAVLFIYRVIITFHRNPPKLNRLYKDGFYDIVFLLQALLLLIATVLYFCGLREYLGLLVLSLALAWINVLYYSRGSKQLGIYSVMVQRMILGDLLNFLCVYSVLLFGFSAAVVTLIKNSHQVEKNNGTLAEGGRFGVEPSEDTKPSYYSFRFTLLEMFKFTIGMGNLDITDDVQYKAVFYILLIFYIFLTFILLFNMIIALMGNTVSTISDESEKIWSLQRALMILNIERTIPLRWKEKLYEEVKGLDPSGNPRRIRVDEMNWKPCRSTIDSGFVKEEVYHLMTSQFPEEIPFEIGSRSSLY